MGRVSEERKKLIENLEKLMRKFSLRDVKTHVLLLFEDLTWDIVVKAINRYNLSSRKADIAKLLAEYAKNLSIEDTREVYGKLLLLDLIIHPKQKKWTGITMRERDEIIADEEYASNMLGMFRKHADIVDIHSNQAENIRWFVITTCRKTKNNSVTHQRPIFLAHPHNSTLVFCSPNPNSISSAVLKMIVSGFGYQDYRIMKLDGNDVHSLKSMDDRQKDAEEIRAKTTRALQSIENGPVCSSKGLNFCANKARAAQAKELFGDESIELQTLTVNFNTEWRGVRMLPQARGKQFPITMRLKSKNVRKSLQEMVQRGVLKEPYPKWAREFLISGKNIMSVA